MRNSYYLEIRTKTRFLNLFRRLFKIWPFEKLLTKLTIGRAYNNFVMRFIPPNYLYKKNSIRNVNRRGINYSLDISNYVEHAIYFGYTDPADEELFRLAEGKHTIIDVGANVGSVVLNLARVAPDANIFGFEPDTSNFLRAQRNLQLNGSRNITLLRKGLGETASTHRLYNVNTNNPGMNRILPEAALPLGDSLSFDDIEVIRLDDFVAENGLKSIELIKIDVEGFEQRVLEGARKSLKEFSPSLFIELDDEYLKEQTASAASVVGFLEEFGYEIRKADGGELITRDYSFDKCHFDIVCTIQQALNT